MNLNTNLLDTLIHTFIVNSTKINLRKNLDFKLSSEADLYVKKYAQYILLSPEEYVLFLI